MNLLQQQQQYNWNSLQTPGSHKQNFHPQYLQNLNPLNPDTDQICEQIYKRILDMSGNIQERYLKICDNMKIEPRDIMLKKVEDFSQNDEKFHTENANMTTASRHRRLQSMNNSIVVGQQQQQHLIPNDRYSQQFPMNKSNYQQQALSNSMFMSPEGSPKTQTFDLVSSMQREKERLHRFLNNREKSQKQSEEYESKIKDLVLKKELKFKRIQEKLRRDMKEQKKKIEIIEYKREQKKKMIEDQVNITYEQSDQQYLLHLEEIKRKEEQRIKKEREQCEIEYRRYNEQFLKSINNYDTFVKEKAKIDLETSKSLVNLEKRLNEGYSRSLQRKDQIRMSAQESLVKLEEVHEFQKKHQQEAETERYMQFLERRQQYLQKIKRWEKQREKSVESLKLQNENKFGQARNNLSEVQYNRDQIYQNLQEKQEQLEHKIQEVKHKKQREIQLRTEKEQLKIQDQKQNLEKQRQSMDRIKQKIIEKHLKLNEQQNKVKENKQHLIEYNRIANELRLQKVSLTSR
eukprot:403351162